jgi:sRNA-binding regulator protein Hfq
MLQSNQPIYPRVKSAQPPQKPTPSVKLSLDDSERKQLRHNEDFLFERRGQPVSVKFLDGEEIKGTVNRIRKFTFVIDTVEHGSVMVYKIGVKYVREAKG